KNDSLGKKLLITGGGRCNLTNAEFDTRKFLEKFKSGGKFLFSAFSQFGVKDALEFFHKLGVETKVENAQRVFPVSDSSQTIFNALLKYLKKNKVEIILNSPVSGILISKEDKNKISEIKVKDGKEILARRVIIATGGTSRPETGSTGDGFAWLRKIGHTVIESAPSLVPIAVKDDWVKKLAGLSLVNVKITTFQNGAMQETNKGKIIFTHFGLSGPAILNMSRSIGELLKYGEVIISLDLFPSEDHGALNLKLQELFKENHNKKFKNTLHALAPLAAGLASAIVEMSKINPDTECNSITRKERLALVDILKNIPIRADKLLGEDRAIVSSGGVSLDEVDFKTMSSRLFPNLYLAGDILNIDRPSGGYSLQLCWTTGFVAGSSADNYKSL
ncbi:MAG: flavoprotein, partial [Parcubacteria group bacterium]|nr:flavoprotein [Parcubacteria group bacterium]